MNPEIEARMFGSQAEFSRLSDSEAFSPDQVSSRLRPPTHLPGPAHPPLCSAPPQVLNKVVFEMSEEGSEVQASGQEVSSPLRLVFNRPFFFCVSEATSNAFLLLGRITDPTA